MKNKEQRQIIQDIYLKFAIRRIEYVVGVRDQDMAYAQVQDHVK